MRKFLEARKERSRRRRRVGEDRALHPQSSVRLHKYWELGRVACSQVNMTYEYCRSHSLASCPPQLLMSGWELAQLLLKAFLIQYSLHRQMDKQTGKWQPAERMWYACLIIYSCKFKWNLSVFLQSKQKKYMYHSHDHTAHNSATNNHVDHYKK